MTGLPGFLNHDTPLNRALLVVAWFRTDPFGDAFDGLAGDIAELAGLDRAVVVRGLADVADLLDRWVGRCPGCDDVIAADALSDVERLIEAARPKQAADQVGETSGERQQATCANCSEPIFRAWTHRTSSNACHSPTPCDPDEPLCEHGRPGAHFHGHPVVGSYRHCDGPALPAEVAS